ncbi:hypothetical protein AKI39_09100 [Bordetella sp. H567]|nr:hypothetical protein AKI39_09100 [Bordetella sp. H567]
MLTFIQPVKQIATAFPALQVRASQRRVMRLPLVFHQELCVPIKVRSAFNGFKFRSEAMCALPW